jgi:predicted kinase
MPKLTILRGLSGSGKSTWARQQNAVVVSRDSIRHDTLGIPAEDYYKVDKKVLFEREELVTRLETSMITALLKAGKDVISDNTNLRTKFAQKIADLGYALGAEVEVKEFDVSLRDAVNNDIFRGRDGGRHVGQEIITKQQHQFAGTRGWSPLRFVPTPYNGTPGKPKAILVDVDGTLAHMTSRGPFDWKKVGEDDVDEKVAQVMEWIHMGMQECVYQTAVIIMSGRDEICRPETEEWFDAAWISYDELYMRPEGDQRKDSIVKAELFDKHVRDNYDVVMVFDDRNQVVDMWRLMGLTVAQVAEGDF